MTQTITYHSLNAKPSECWIAYVVLPNGENWSVRFNGVTEQEAIDRALALYAKEKAKAPVVEVGSWSSTVPTHHAAGKKWIKHSVTGDKRRIDAVEAEKMVNSGEWIYAGPRG